MPFSRPSLARLISRAQADIEQFLENGGSRVRRSVEWVMSRVLAGLAHGLHGHIAFVAQQIIPDTAEDDMLVRWASVWGIDRLQPTQAEFSIQVTGVNGTPLPEGTVFQTADGVQYATEADVAIPASGPAEVSVLVLAVVAGAAGNVEAGTELSLVVPVAGIDTAAIVEGDDGELVGDGSDLETIEALRTRLLERIQTPPSGGGPGDYVAWAKQVSGVTRAWELPQQLGPGTVVVLFVQDLFDADGNFSETDFPGGTQVDEVQDYIDARAPVTANVTVQAPINLPLDPTIQLSPNTADVQLQVIAQLNDLLLRRAAPGGTLLLSEINEAISLAPDEVDHVLVLPAANVEAEATELITLGDVTFQAIP